MNSTDCIDKIGIVSKIENKRITIQLLTSEACGTCKIKSFCIQENDNVDFDINNISENHSESFKPGDIVKLIINKKYAYKAVFYIYFIPSLLIIFLLIILSKKINELIAGFSVLLLVLLYYSFLGIFNKKINNNIKVTIKKLSNNE